MDVTQLYEQIILDHSKHPKGAGLREPYDAQAHHVNPTCGDEVTIRVALEGGTIRDVSYQGDGCSISRASASVLYELVRGATLEHTSAVQGAFHAMVTGRGQVEPDEELLEDAIAFAGVARYPMRVKCALLPWMAFKDAMSRAVGTAADTPGEDALGEAAPGADVPGAQASGVETPDCPRDTVMEATS